MKDFLTIDENECCQLCEFNMTLITKTQNKVQSTALKIQSITSN